ncbi:NlpC/P60 family protein [Cryobacterium melibiosiphilum]|uniref:NlpC/P60 family protein n=2 Tax=Cryobacterium melibiosiphilum TaxID=995039 RepID=A0A3A5MMC0_9MICO|nr:NlpC/P60 family protein [Cryobacterium melibiosiphilum]
MAALDTRRSRREQGRTAIALQSAPAAGTQVQPHKTMKRTIRRGKVGNVVVMSLAFGLMATLSIPAYAFAPDAADSAFAATESTELTKTQAQAVEVDAGSATLTVARDGFTATTPEELAAAAAEVAASEAAAAAEARRIEVSSQLTTYATSYSGPSAADYLANPTYPDFDLASVYNVASQYQGTPYVYGGATPAGFDCSGFIMYVYAQFGISLPHSSNGQAAAGTRIAIEDAVPGDLVIMPGHDGFYAGNGNILHAPYTGQSVRVQPIWTSDYYIVRIGI